MSDIVGVQAQFTYITGERVMKGDRLVWHGDLGVVEYVVDQDCQEEAQLWHLSHAPQGGIMIRVPTIVLGMVFEQDTDHLSFVTRAAVDGGHP